MRASIEVPCIHVIGFGFSFYALQRNLKTEVSAKNAAATTGAQSSHFSISICPRRAISMQKAEAANCRLIPGYIYWSRKKAGYVPNPARAS